MKYNHTILLILLFGGIVCYAQNKSEREYRIKKSEFPTNAIEFIKEEIVGAKKLRFYKELDSTKIIRKARLKKDKLYYCLEFDASGTLKDVEVVITRVDIPNDSFSEIQAYLEKNINNHKIRRISQQYLVTEEISIETTVKNAFQNLILPSINYELIVSGSSDKGRREYEVLFDYKGSFKSLRKLVAPNYDHVLY